MDEFVVTDPAMARLLTTLNATACLGPFLEHDRSVAEVARLQGKPLGRVHYWVRRLTDAGLLVVTSEVARAGRPIKRYRAVASRFRVPAALLPLDHYERVMGRLNAEFTRSLTAVSDMPNQDMTVSPGRSGDVSIDRMHDPASARRTRALQTAMGDLHLTDAQALELWSALDALRTRFQEASNRETPDARPYLVHLSMAPRLAE